MQTKGNSPTPRHQMLRTRKRGLMPREFIPLTSLNKKPFFIISMLMVGSSFRKGYKPPNSGEMVGKKDFFKYHCSWTHSTNSCVVFRNMVQPSNSTSWRLGLLRDRLHRLCLPKLSRAIVEPTVSARQYMQSPSQLFACKLLPNRPRCQVLED